MIIASAGHVDHGKTSMIKALTGVDADRLPEEKRRGLTIDLGFAYLPVQRGEPIGFVDVPGHERFVHNMLCGVVGIDAVVLVVAADDGPMPQTREHVAILDLLGIRVGAIVITKIDLVSEERLAEADQEVQGLVRSTSLAELPVFQVSAVSGLGVIELRRYLEELSLDIPMRPSTGNFRLAVDRSFLLKGTGLVVTGTVFSGETAVGDSARALIANAEVRIRSIHSQNRESTKARAGQRCALSLAGPGTRNIARGDWIVGAPWMKPSTRLDGLLRVVAQETAPLLHWSPVHLHIGASDVMARVAVLEGCEIAPGASRFVQLLTEEPVAATYGDRFIVRDQNARRTIGGGRIIDILPRQRRKNLARLDYLYAMDSEDDEIALAQVLAARPDDCTVEDFVANRNLSPAQRSRLFGTDTLRIIDGSDRQYAMTLERWSALQVQVLSVIQRLQRESPATVLNREHIFNAADVRLPPPVTVAILDELVNRGQLIRRGSSYQTPLHQHSLQPELEAARQAVVAFLARSRQPCSTTEIAAEVHVESGSLGQVLRLAANRGELLQVCKSRYVHLEALAKLAAVVEEIARNRADGAVPTPEFKLKSELGRNKSIEILELFDRMRFTRRVRDQRVVIQPFRKATAEYCRDHAREGNRNRGALGLQIR